MYREKSGLSQRNKFLIQRNSSLCIRKYVNIGDTYLFSRSSSVPTSITL